MNYKSIYDYKWHTRIHLLIFETHVFTQCIQIFIYSWQTWYTYRLRRYFDSACNYFIQ